MIISASRRTDIPAFHAPWLLRRLREGHVLVPNPRNRRQISRVALTPDAVDCLVFWTKNPEPMLDMLAEITRMGHAFYFQFTLTPYGQEMEPGLPPKRRLTEVFRRLSALLGPNRVIWRYDPVILTPEMLSRWHVERFSELCDALGRHTKRCVFSFFDDYRHIHPKFPEAGRADMLAVAQGFARVAARHSLQLATCAEDLDMREYGIRSAACINAPDLEELLGCPVSVKKDTGQRPACGCVESADIGVYNTCAHGCVYCYARTGPRPSGTADPTAPLLWGNLRGDEIVTERRLPSIKRGQFRLL